MKVTKLTIKKNEVKVHFSDETYVIFNNPTLLQIDALKKLVSKKNVEAVLDEVDSSSSSSSSNPIVTAVNEPLEAQIKVLEKSIGKVSNGTPTDDILDKLSLLYKERDSLITA